MTGAGPGPAGPADPGGDLPAPARLIDARGLLCPLPVLRLRKVLAGMAPGSHAALLATDPAAVIDVPHFCAQSGHVLVAARAAGAGTTEYLVRRGDDG
mgnify:CR=1 FL=1